MPTSSNHFVSRLLQRADLFFTAGLFVTVLLLIVPVPPFVLDALIALSIGLSLLVLLAIVYVKDPPEFSGFPTILLTLTLFRLALNISSTRQILIKGYAGHIIESFGHFVIQGNYIVGAVVFIILVVINFVVITKGAGRIAEVAARFTLDAMPGKQMAIDAELNAGIIDEVTATTRRLYIQKEADFYGAMDGASKFVRGDAVAGILITLVNVVGGFAIGVLQMDLTLSESLQKFTLLSIGDGLISQIPALIVSIGARPARAPGLLGQHQSRHADRQPALPLPRALATARPRACSPSSASCPGCPADPLSGAWPQIAAVLARTTSSSGAVTGSGRGPAAGAEQRAARQEGRGQTGRGRGRASPCSCLAWRGRGRAQADRGRCLRRDRNRPRPPRLAEAKSGGEFLLRPRHRRAQEHGPGSAASSSCPISVSRQS